MSGESIAKNRAGSMVPLLLEMNKTEFPVYVKMTAFLLV